MVAHPLLSHTEYGTSIPHPIATFICHVDGTRRQLEFQPFVRGFPFITSISISTLRSLSTHDQSNSISRSLRRTERSTTESFTLHLQPAGLNCSTNAIGPRRHGPSISLVWRDFNSARGVGRGICDSYSSQFLCGGCSCRKKQWIVDGTSSFSHPYLTLSCLLIQRLRRRGCLVEHA